MNYEDHVAAARTFLSAAEILSASGMGMAAAEMVWGATVQAIDAVNHRMAITRHPNNNRDRLRILERLERAHGMDGALHDGFRSVVKDLHNHFYRGDLSSDSLERHMRNGISFARLMLELADSSR